MFGYFHHCLLDYNEIYTKNLLLLDILKSIKLILCEKHRLNTNICSDYFYIDCCTTIKPKTFHCYKNYKTHMNRLTQSVMTYLLHLKALKRWTLHIQERNVQYLMMLSSIWYKAEIRKSENWIFCQFCMNSYSQSTFLFLSINWLTTNSCSSYVCKALTKSKIEFKPFI